MTKNSQLIIIEQLINIIRNLLLWYEKRMLHEFKEYPEDLIWEETRIKLKKINLIILQRNQKNAFNTKEKE